MDWFLNALQRIPRNLAFNAQFKSQVKRRMEVWKCNNLEVIRTIGSWIISLRSIPRRVWMKASCISIYVSLGSPWISAQLIDYYCLVFPLVLRDIFNNVRLPYLYYLTIYLSRKLFTLCAFLSLAYYYSNWHLYNYLARTFSDWQTDTFISQGWSIFYSDQSNEQFCKM